MDAAVRAYDSTKAIFYVGGDALVATLGNFAWIGEKTFVVKIRVLDDMATSVAKMMDMESSLIRFTLSLLAVYPLAAVLRALPGATSKHWFNILVGVFLMQWIYREDWIHSFLSSLGTYLICRLAPRKYAAQLAFVWGMGYMTASHWYKMYTAYMTGVFDFTGTQMVLTMKLTSLGYNLFDGIYDHKRVFPETVNADPKVAATLEKRRKVAVTRMPSPLEFFGYSYCFTSLLVGPAFEFQDYLAACDGSAYVATVRGPEPAGKDKDVQNKPPPSSLAPAVAALLTGLTALVIRTYLVARGFGLYKVLNLSRDVTAACAGKELLAECVRQQCSQQLEAEGYGLVAYGDLFIEQCVAKISSGKFYQLTAPLFSNPNWIAATPNTLLRFLLLMGCLWTERVKYFFIWKTAEGACIMAGYGFEGFDAAGRVIGWHGVENVDIWGIETAWSVQMVTRAWNKKTQHWLDMYTYQRTGRSLLAVYFVSALWHGLYPGFYAFFLSVPAVTEVERLAREKLNPIFIPKYKYPGPYPLDPWGLSYAILGFCCYYPVFNYVGQNFMQGTLINCSITLGSLFYTPYLALAVAYVFLSLLPKPKTKNTSKIS